MITLTTIIVTQVPERPRRQAARGDRARRCWPASRRGSSAASPSRGSGSRRSSRRSASNALLHGRRPPDHERRLDLGRAAGPRAASRSTKTLGSRTRCIIAVVAIARRRRHHPHDGHRAALRRGRARARPPRTPRASASRPTRSPPTSFASITYGAAGHPRRRLPRHAGASAPATTTCCRRSPPSCSAARRSSGGVGSVVATGSRRALPDPARAGRARHGRAGVRPVRDPGLDHRARHGGAAPCTGVALRGVPGAPPALSRACAGNFRQLHPRRTRYPRPGPMTPSRARRLPTSHPRDEPGNTTLERGPGGRSMSGKSIDCPARGKRVSMPALALLVVVAGGDRHRAAAAAP